jgi:hypothetical protein
VAAHPVRMAELDKPVSRDDRRLVLAMVVMGIGALVIRLLFPH